MENQQEFEKEKLEFFTNTSTLKYDKELKRAFNALLFAIIYSVVYALIFVSTK